MNEKDTEDLFKYLELMAQKLTAINSKLNFFMLLLIIALVLQFFGWLLG